jgi:hypothetical protein
MTPRAICSRGTDARGVNATYMYDGINRATQVTYSNGVSSEVHRFQYDARRR